jgi:hypothetical protein
VNLPELKPLLDELWNDGIGDGLRRPRMTALV